MFHGPAFFTERGIFCFWAFSFLLGGSFGPSTSTDSQDRGQRGGFQ